MKFTSIDRKKRINPAGRKRLLGIFAKAAERMLYDYLYVLGVSDGQ
jgi:hypothetical protein